VCARGAAGGGGTEWQLHLRSPVDGLATFAGASWVPSLS
jgi:hypothetical protein